MTSFNSKEDFLRALEENPQWREAVRALILGEELLLLPVQFRAFAGQVSSFIDQTEAFISEQRQFNAEQRQTNERMEGFVAEQRQTNERMEGFVAEQRQTNERMEGFVAEQRQTNERMEGFVAEQRQTNERMEGFVAEQRQFNEVFVRRLTRIEGDMTNFRGTYAENAAERNAAAIAAELGLEYVRSVPQQDLVRMSRSATGRVPINQLRSFWTADLIIEASDGSDTHYIAVESSYTADQRDTDRVQRNVQFLTEFTGQTARGVIASVRNDRYAESQVESGGVYWFPLKDRGPQPE